MINVVLKPKKEIRVSLKPEQGIQIEATKKYLFDPSVVQTYVDASAENALKAEEQANRAEQTVADVSAFVDTSKSEITGIIEQGKTEIATAIDDGRMEISDSILEATEEVKKAGQDAAQEAVQGAADEATRAATERVNTYVVEVVSPQIQEFVNNAEADASNAAESAGLAAEEANKSSIFASDSQHYAKDARIWAEGEQAEVKELGGELSSMGAADLAYAIANAPEDTPIDTSSLFALNIFKGEKGDKGDKGDAGKDGKDAESFDAKGFLNLIYPVGSIYISTTSTCPIASYGVGTWELVGKDRVLQGAGTRGNVNATINAGLPNITGSYTPKTSNDDTWSSGTYSGALYQLTSGQKGASSSDYSTNVQYGVGFDASRSNSIYGKSTTVQPDAYLVNIFRRIS